MGSIVTVQSGVVTGVVGNTNAVDAFGRLRVSHGVSVFDAQLTYDLQPLIFEQIKNGSGSNITFDSTNRCALMTFASTPTGGKAFMQSFECVRYAPGRSQKATITFNFVAQVANTLKFAAYGDGTNGVEFQNTGALNQFVLYSGTSVGNQTVVQSSWSQDKLDGTGPSGKVLDLSKVQILILDLQALYSGRVRIGFNIDGVDVYCHHFLASNVITNPYIQSANLPIRCGMTCTGTVSTTMNFTCCSVQNEGLLQDPQSYPFAVEGTGTAGSGALTHILSIRPTTTFNSITNRIKILMEDATFVATSASPLLYQIVIGQAISGTTTFSAVNSTYSGIEFNTAGTISGNAAIVLQQGYIPQSNVGVTVPVTLRSPISLDAAGAVRALGTLTLLCLGIGGAVNMRASFNWSEVR